MYSRYRGSRWWAAVVMVCLGIIWSNKQLPIEIKLNLYNNSLVMRWVISVLLYGSAAWTFNSAWEWHLNAFDTKFLRRILGLHWYDFVPNITLRQVTKHPFHLPSDKVLQASSIWSSCKAITTVRTIQPHPWTKSWVEEAKGLLFLLSYFTHMQKGMIFVPLHFNY